MLFQVHNMARGLNLYKITIDCRKGRPVESVSCTPESGNAEKERSMLSEIRNQGQLVLQEQCRRMTREHKREVVSQGKTIFP